jgi:uncharacterized protein YneF (UPF0154 family)
MDTQTLTILIMGGAVVVFAFFGSYMAARQKEREEQEREHDAIAGLPCKRR